VTIASGFQESNSNIQGIATSGSYGAALWLESAFYFTLKNSAFYRAAYPASIPAEIYAADWMSIEQNAFGGGPPFECTTNCGVTGYQASIRFSSGPPSRSGNGCAQCQPISGNVFQGSIKFDTNGVGGLLGGVVIRDSVVEEPQSGAIVIDPRNATGEPIGLDSVYAQDNFNGFTTYQVYSTDPATAFSVNVKQMRTVGLVNSLTGNPEITNTYYQGLFQYSDFGNDDSFDPPPTWTAGRGNTPPGTIENGSEIDSEIRGLGLSNGPSVAPFATGATNITASTWTCVANCTTSTVADPFGGTNAGQLTSTGATGYATVYNVSSTVTTGDYFLYGSWVRPGPGIPYTFNQYCASNGPFEFQAASPITFANQVTPGSACPNNYTMLLTGDGWKAQVALATVATGGTGYIALNLFSPSSNTQGQQFACPFVVGPIPASVPIDLVEVWRQWDYHGCVPPGIAAGVAATVSPIAAPSFQHILPVVTASLPTCNAANLLMRAAVTDSISAVPGAAPTGSGTYTIAVQCIENSTGPVYSWVVD
jgi:hypothetical protein